MSLPIEKIDEVTWRLPKEGKMRVEGIVFASEKMMNLIRDDMSLEQLRNVATLPGIVSRAFAMPDVHWGYGFPIGGVAAFDEKKAWSPGEWVRHQLRSSAFAYASRWGRCDPAFVSWYTLFQNIPTGVGAHHQHFKLSREDEREILRKGASWPVRQGLEMRRTWTISKKEDAFRGRPFPGERSGLTSGAATSWEL
jgi:tRNA-splicing ligase RtcB